MSKKTPQISEVFTLAYRIPVSEFFF